VLSTLSSTGAHFSVSYWCSVLSFLLVLAFLSSYWCSLLCLLLLLTSLPSILVFTTLSSTGAHCILLLLLTSLPSILVFTTLSSTGPHFSRFLLVLTTLSTIYAHNFFPIYAYYCSRVASSFSLFRLVFLFISDHIDASTFDKQPVYHLLLFNAGLLYFPREVLPEEQWQKRRGWLLSSPQGMRIRVLTVLNVLALQMKNRWESNINAPFRFIYSQKWNCRPRYFLNRIIMFCLSISTFMYLWAIYIFPESVCLFCCSQIGRPILGIYKSLTDTVPRQPS
jgi:hypothetical protein